MVFQSYALYPHMTVRDNLGFGLRIRKMDKAEIERRIAEAARLLGLETLLERYPKQLSGGQRQRVAMGRAIVRRPEVFLFDEPLSNLDAALRVQMRAELTRLHQRLKTTMIYVTHDQVEAMTLADRIMVLNGGEVQQVGAPLELYHRPANRFVAGFIGSPAMNFLPGKMVGEEDGQGVVEVGGRPGAPPGGPAPAGGGPAAGGGHAPGAPLGRRRRPGGSRRHHRGGRAHGLRRPRPRAPGRGAPEVRQPPGRRRRSGRHRPGGVGAGGPSHPRRAAHPGPRPQPDPPLRRRARARHRQPPPPATRWCPRSPPPAPDPAAHASNRPAPRAPGGGRRPPGARRSPGDAHRGPLAQLPRRRGAAPSRGWSTGLRGAAPGHPCPGDGGPRQRLRQQDHQRRAHGKRPGPLHRRPRQRGAVGEGWSAPAPRPKTLDVGTAEVHPRDPARPQLPRGISTASRSPTRRWCSSTTRP